MSTMSFVPTSQVVKAQSRSGLLLTGPRFPLLFAAGLPAAVVALSCEGPARQLSALIAVGWFSLVPLALYNRWIALALPLVAAVFLTATLAALPLGSTALTVDLWTAATMFVLSVIK